MHELCYDLLPAKGKLRSKYNELPWVERLKLGLKSLREEEKEAKQRVFQNAS